MSTIPQNENRGVHPIGRDSTVMLPTDEYVRRYGEVPYLKAVVLDSFFHLLRGDFQIRNIDDISAKTPIQVGIAVLSNSFDISSIDVSVEPIDWSSLINFVAIINIAGLDLQNKVVLINVFKLYAYYQFIIRNVLNAKLRSQNSILGIAYDYYKSALQVGRGNFNYYQTLLNYYPENQNMLFYVIAYAVDFLIKKRGK